MESRGQDAPSVKRTPLVYTKMVRPEVYVYVNRSIAKVSSRLLLPMRRGQMIRR